MIVFKEDVKEEIAVAYDWYEKKKPGLGEEF